MPCLERRRLLLAALVGASAALAPLAVAGRAHAYTLKSTSSGASVRWHRSALSLDLAYVGEDTMPRATVHAALEMAAASWTGVPGLPSLSVRDTGENDASWGYDGVNGVYVLARWPFDDRRLAVTVSTRREETGELLDTDILVNGEMALGLLSHEHGEDRFDLALVLTHELGHVLGLDESEVPEATMWPTIRRREIERRELSTDDVDGALALYGREPARSTARTGCSIVPGRGAPHAAALLLGVLATLIARRRRHARS